MQDEKLSDINFNIIAKHALTVLGLDVYGATLEVKHTVSESSTRL